MLCDLRGPFLVEVSVFDFHLKFLKLVGVGADPLDFLLAAFIGHLHACHFSGKLFLHIGRVNLGRLLGIEVSILKRLGHLGSFII